MFCEHSRYLVIKKSIKDITTSSSRKNNASSFVVAEEEEKEEVVVVGNIVGPHEAWGCVI